MYKRKIEYWDKELPSKEFTMMADSYDEIIKEIENRNIGFGSLIRIERVVIL